VKNAGYRTERITNLGIMPRRQWVFAYMMGVKHLLMAMPYVKNTGNCNASILPRNANKLSGRVKKRAGAN
jgi:hypothetical protein